MLWSVFVLVPMITSNCWCLNGCWQKHSSYSNCILWTLSRLFCSFTGFTIFQSYLYIRNIRHPISDHKRAHLWVTSLPHPPRRLFGWKFNFLFALHPGCICLETSIQLKPRDSSAPLHLYRGGNKPAATVSRTEINSVHIWPGQLHPPTTRYSLYFLCFMCERTHRSRANCFIYLFIYL